MSKDWKEMERVVAKKLGAWWGCKFRRTPSSGAWSKQANKSASDDFHGDIVAPPSANFPFSVECKAYETVELYLALYGQSNIFKWWTQCLGDAKRVKKHPMLIMRENRKQRYLVAVSIGTWMAMHRPADLKMTPRMTLRFMQDGVVHQLVIQDLDLFTGQFYKEQVSSLLGS